MDRIKQLGHGTDFTKESSSLNRVRNHDNQQQAKRTHHKHKHHEGMRVDISLSKAINEELDAEKMEEERVAKVAELKKLVQSGSYNPSSEEVARSLGQELVFEILSYSGDDEE